MVLHFISIGVLYQDLGQVQNWVTLTYFPSVKFCLVDGISQERFNIATSVLQCRWTISRPRTSSKLGHLDLLFMIMELFLEYPTIKDGIY